MIKIIPPKPFFYKGGEKAVLLLHSFTSNPVDMKKLGKHLQVAGYTCYGPLYSGHGVTAEEILTFKPSEWWQDVLDGYQLLKGEGFEKIAVVGLSLGGIFALKAGQELAINGIVTMSVPSQREATFLQKRVFHYAKGYKQLEGKNEEQIELEIKQLKQQSVDSLVAFQQLIDQTMEGLPQLTAPIRIFYGELDDPLYKESAAFIGQNISANDKQIKGFPNSKHLMTLGPDMPDVNDDILAFLNDLAW